MTDRRRRWLKVLVILMVLLPGLPYLAEGLLFLVSPFDGAAIILLGLALLIHFVYFGLASLLVGKDLYTFIGLGFDPSFGGYVVAAILYGIIAFGLSFPIARGLEKRKTRHEAKQGPPEGMPRRGPSGPSLDRREK